MACLQGLVSQGVEARRHIGWNIAPLYAFISITWVTGSPNYSDAGFAAIGQGRSVLTPLFWPVSNGRHLEAEQRG